MLASSAAMWKARRLQGLRLGFGLQKDYLCAVGQGKLRMASGVEGSYGEKGFVSFHAGSIF